MDETLLCSEVHYGNVQQGSVHYMFFLLLAGELNACRHIIQEYCSAASSRHHDNYNAACRTSGNAAAECALSTVLACTCKLPAHD